MPKEILVVPTYPLLSVMVTGNETVPNNVSLPEIVTWALNVKWSPESVKDWGVPPIELILTVMELMDVPPELGTPVTLNVV